MYNSGIKKIISGITALFLIAATLILGDTIFKYVFDQDDTPSVSQTTGYSEPLVTVPTSSSLITFPSEPETTAAPQTESTTASTQPSEPAETTAQNEPSADTSTTDGGTDPSSAPVSVDVTTMTKEQIVAMLGDAVNKTKAYTDTLTVAHKEAFDAKVTDCTGGSVVANIANSALGSIAKPSDETLTFVNGSAVNGEGETIQVLLPKAANFTLTADGVETAKAVKDGENTVVKLKLVPESTGLGEVPKYAAAGVGYLDIASLDLPVDVTQANAQYNGLEISAVIRPDGYISAAVYVTPVHLELAAKLGFVEGSAVIDVTETESFEIQWN